MPGALDGIRVIDFGQYVAGPMVGMLLGDQGADVVRIDPPGGPLYDGPANVAWNRNKRSIVLDLKQPADLSVARRLIAGADIVVENFRPGVLERLGLSAAAMVDANPGLIYCSLPGFASDDPRSGVRAWEGVVAAAAGTYRLNEESGRPVYTTLPFSSYFAAFQGAAAIAMALNARQRDGRGQTIEVPLYDATFGALGARITFHRRPRAPRPPGDLLGNYRCGDGRWVSYVSGNKAARSFLESVGGSEWSDATNTGLMSAEEFDEKARTLFLSRPAAEWEAYCEEIGTECSVCRPSSEWLDHPGALESGIVIDIEDRLLGTVRGPGVNVRMSASPHSTPTSRPAADAHRDEIIAELDGTPAARPVPDADELRRALQGVRVLDLCIVLAGPTCARTLAEYGADVIKIEAPPRAGREPFHNDTNRGKRSLILDLKSRAGREVFWRLVDRADVVVQNFRKGVAERLGLGYETVRARNMRVVYASLNTYGHVGPLAGRPGHEQIAQAATGMQERYGGDGRPVTAPFAANDYGTGYMGAYAVALALLHRERTGEGQHVDTALAYTATMLQSSVIHRYRDDRPNEPRGQDALGESPLARCYEAADGWLYIQARQEELEECVGLEGLGDLNPAELERALEDKLRERPVENWVGALGAAGIGAHAVVPDATDLIDDPWMIDHGLIATREHDGIGPVTTTGPTPRLSRTPVTIGHPAPRPGSHAAEILAEIGMQDELGRLVEEGAILLEPAEVLQ